MWEQRYHCFHPSPYCNLIQNILLTIVSENFLKCFLLFSLFSQKKIVYINRSTSSPPDYTQIDPNLLPHSRKKRFPKLLTTLKTNLPQTQTPSPTNSSHEKSETPRPNYSTQPLGKNVIIVHFQNQRNPKISPTVLSSLLNTMRKVFQKRILTQIKEALERQEPNPF